MHDRRGGKRLALSLGRNPETAAAGRGLSARPESAELRFQPVEEPEQEQRRGAEHDAGGRMGEAEGLPGQVEVHADERAQGTEPGGGGRLAARDGAIFHENKSVPTSEPEVKSKVLSFRDLLKDSLSPPRSSI